MADYILAANGAFDYTPNPVGYSLPGFVEMINEPAQTANIRSIAIAPGNTMVAFGLQSTQDRLTLYTPDPTAAWTLLTGTPTMAAGAWSMSRMAFSPSGGQLAVYDGGDATNRVKVYNTGNWALEGTPPSGNLVDVDGGLEWSPDGTMLAAGQASGDTNTLVIWNTTTWTVVSGTPVKANTYALAWSPDGSMLAVGGYDGVDALFVHDTSTWARITPGPAVSASFTVHDIKWSPSGDRIVARTNDTAARIRVFETAGWNPWASLGSADGLSAARSMGFTPSGDELVVTQSSGSTLVVVETATWTVVTAGMPAETQNLGALAISTSNFDPGISMLSDAVGSSSLTGDVLALIALSMVDSATGSSTMTGGAIFTSELFSSALGSSTVTVGVIVPASMISSGTGSTTLDLQATLLALMYSYAAGNSVVPLEGDGQAAWAINVETGASTRYEQYPFNSFARIDGKYYGAREDGIYLLEGDTDNGVPVQAMVDFGKQSFGTQAAKRMISAWFGASSSGRLFLRVVAEGEEYVYAARDSSEELQEQRVDIGRGLRANWFAFQLYTADGDDFELASVEFTALPLSRRT